MRKTFWDKRIPTLLGIFLITIGIGITSFLVQQGIIIVGRATPSSTPKNVRIANVTDNSFTVSYQTEASVIGSINFGKDSSFGQTALDDRDQKSGAISPHTIHSITARNLSPSTKYLFSITSGQEVYLNNDLPFEISTGTKIESEPTTQEPITGKVVLPDGTNPKEAIIYIAPDNAQVISALVHADGSYIVPLNSIRSRDLSSYYVFPKGATLKTLFIGDALTSNVSLSIEQVTPVPVITLSKNYDFTSTSTPLASPSGQIEQQQNLPSFTSTPKSTGQSPQITTPKEDEKFTDLKPVFKGTALPSEKVEIVIHSQENIQTSVTTDASGNWTYRPPKDLSPGEHTITITTKDISGILKTITQSFTVYASGSRFTDGATPTPTPTIKPTITLTPTPTSSSTPTLTPTPISSITPTLTPTPTIMATLTPTPIPTIEVLPETGNETTILIAAVGIAITLIGGFLFVASRGFISL